MIIIVEAMYITAIGRVGQKTRRLRRTSSKEIVPPGEVCVPRCERRGLVRLTALASRAPPVREAERGGVVLSLAARPASRIACAPLRPASQSGASENCALCNTETTTKPNV